MVYVSSKFEFFVRNFESYQKTTMRIHKQICMVIIYMQIVFGERYVQCLLRSTVKTAWQARGPGFQSPLGQPFQILQYGGGYAWKGVGWKIYKY